MLKYFSILFSLVVLLASSIAQSATISKKMEQCVDVRTFTSLSAAVVSPLTNGRTILIVSPVSCNSLTIPADRRLKIIEGGSIKIAPGMVLTVAGYFDAGLFQTFVGNGNVNFINGSTKIVHPEWFGAKANGLVDSTEAMQRAIDSITAGMVSLSPGVYNISDAVKLLNKSNLEIIGNDSLIRQKAAAKELIHISGSSHIILKDLALYGVLETAGPIGTENSIRIDPNLPGTVNNNTDILIDNISFKHNGLNAIYLGGDTSTYGSLSNVTVTNCRMEYGLSFMLAVGVKRLTVDNIKIVHRNTAPVGAGISQDEDIAVISANRVSCENVKISNIMIDARGSVKNAFTGHAKLDFAIGETGLSFVNLSVTNVVVKDNLGNFAPSYGTDGSTLYVSDVNANRKGFINAQFSNISIINSPGIFIEANNLKFNNISLATFPTIPGWNNFGRAIDSNQAISTGGCIFNDVSINGWSSSPSIYTAEGGVIFNNLKVTNSTGSVWAVSNSIYNHMVIDDVSDIYNGAFYVSGDSNNIVISNSVFKNNGNTALKENENNGSIGSSLINISFENNRADTNINYNNWDTTKAKKSQFIKSTSYKTTHHFIGNYHYWLDESGTLRANSKAPLTDSDGTVVGTQLQ
jgi:hypothetical protein